MTHNQQINIIKGILVAGGIFVILKCGWTAANNAELIGLIGAVNMGFGQVQKNIDPDTGNLPPSAKNT